MFSPQIQQPAQQRVRLQIHVVQSLGMVASQPIQPPPTVSESAQKSSAWSFDDTDRSSTRGETLAVRPWTQPVLATDTLEELVRKIRDRWHRLYKDCGALDIIELRDYWDSTLDLSDLVSDVFDDRSALSPTGNIFTSVCKVICGEKSDQLKKASLHGSLPNDSSGTPKRTLSASSLAAVSQHHTATDMGTTNAKKTAPKKAPATTAKRPRKAAKTEDASMSLTGTDHITDLSSSQQVPSLEDSFGISDDSYSLPPFVPAPHEQFDFEYGSSPQNPYQYLFSHQQGVFDLKGSTVAPVKLGEEVLPSTHPTKTLDPKRLLLDHSASTVGASAASVDVPQTQESEAKLPPNDMVSDSSPHQAIDAIDAHSSDQKHGLGDESLLTRNSSTNLDFQASLNAAHNAAAQQIRDEPDAQARSPVDDSLDHDVKSDHGTPHESMGDRAGNGKTEEVVSARHLSIQKIFADLDNSDSGSDTSSTSSVSSTSNESADTNAAPMRRTIDQALDGSRRDVPAKRFRSLSLLRSKDEQKPLFAGQSHQTKTQRPVKQAKTMPTSFDMRAKIKGPFHSSDEDDDLESANQGVRIYKALRG